jgi:hypothetical protein
MRNAKWWTTETTFVAGMGVVMAVVFGISFFTRQGSSTGSDLVPAAVLAKLINQGAQCQTITDDDIDNHVPKPRC